MRIRLAEPEDAEDIAAIYRPVVEASAVSFELEAPDATVMAARIDERMPAYPWLVAHEGGRVTAYAYASRLAPRAAYEWSVETSVYVADASQRRGLARALYSALFEILGMQGFRQALAGIALPNPASVALHEATGFAPAGVFRAVGFKLGRWHDVGWWQRPVGPASTDAPAGPLNLTGLPEGFVDQVCRRVER